MGAADGATPQLRDAPRPRVTRGDLAGALALHLSQGIGLTILFLSGSALGHYAGFGTWRSGFVMLAIGVALVSVVIAFGG